jgi:hypothetical protein
MHGNLFNKNLLQAAGMAWVLVALLGSGLAQWLSEKWRQPWTARMGHLHAGDITWLQGQTSAGTAPGNPRGDASHTTQGAPLHGAGHESHHGPASPHTAGNDAIAVVARENKETVALWLAGSWRCNLGPASRAEATWMERHAFLRVEQAARDCPDTAGVDPSRGGHEINTPTWGDERC